ASASPTVRSTNVHPAGRHYRGPPGRGTACETQETPARPEWLWSVVALARRQASAKGLIPPSMRRVENALCPTLGGADVFFGCLAESERNCTYPFGRNHCGRQ